MAKPKTIAAIEPNVGLRNKLAKRITQICQALTKYAERQIVADLLDKGLLQDAPAEPMGMECGAGAYAARKGPARAGASQRSSE